MPYLPTNRKKELEIPSVFPDKEGDWNFLYSKAYLAFWNQPGNQRYHNIHRIGKASIFPEAIYDVKLVEDRLIAEGINPVDRNIARGCAWLEFYSRIGSFYERFARIKNGDLEEYKVAIKQMEKLVQEFYAGVSQ